jgi:Cytochrome P450/Dihydrodipicolinate synthetase family
MLYNNPFTTGVNLDAATLAAFGRDVENIKYVKASSKDWEQALRIIHHLGDDIGLIMGWDSYSFSALLEGAVELMAGNHVAFGFGPHQCVGQQLARAELQIVYPTLFRRIPTLRLAIASEDVPFAFRELAFGIYSPPVTW